MAFLGTTDAGVKRSAQVKIGSPYSLTLVGTLGIPLSMLAVAVIALLPYLRSLDFAFFNDDPSGNLRWLEGRHWYELFVSSVAYGYGYYRPFGFSIWRLLHDLFGGYYAPGYHAVSLAVHGLTVSLLWLFAYRFGKRYAYAWFVALAFATFPLSYEAVGYVAALFHPLVTCLTLGALLLYRKARQPDTPRRTGIFS